MSGSYLRSYFHSCLIHVVSYENVSTSLQVNIFFGGGGSCILEIMDILPINALQNPARSLLQHNTVETFLHYHTLLSDL